MFVKKGELIMNRRLNNFMHFPIRRLKAFFLFVAVLFASISFPDLSNTIEAKAATVYTYTINFADGRSEPGSFNQSKLELYEIASDGSETLIPADFTGFEGSNGWLRQTTITSEHEKVSLKIVWNGASANCGVYGDGLFVLSAKYSDVYLVQGVWATYYITGDTEDNTVTVSIVKDNNEADITYYYADASSVSDLNAIKTVSGPGTVTALTKELTPNGGDMSGKYVLSLTSEKDKNLTDGAFVWFKIRSTILNQGNSSAMTFGGRKADDVDPADSKNAGYKMGTGSQVYRYTINFADGRSDTGGGFNQSKLELFEVAKNGKETPVTAVFQNLEGSNGYLRRAVIISKNEKLSLKAVWDDKNPNCGIFKDGRFTVSAKYPDVYLVQGVTGAYYITGDTKDNTITVTVVKDNDTKDITYYYAEDGAVTDTSAVKTVGTTGEVKALTSLLTPDGGGNTSDKYELSLTSVPDKKLTAGALVWFKVRSAFDSSSEGNSTAVMTIGGKNKSDEDTGERKNLGYVMPGGVSLGFSEPEAEVAEDDDEVFEPPYLYTVDVFGASEAVTLKNLNDGKDIECNIDDSNPNFLRYTFISDSDNISLQVSGGGISSCGVFETARKFILTPKYSHVYVVKDIPATYYVRANSEGKVTITLLKKTGTGMNFHYETLLSGTKTVPYNNSKMNVELSDELTPKGEDKSGKFQIQLSPNDPVQGEMYFKIRSEMGAGFFHTANNTWYTVFGTDPVDEGGAGTKYAQFTVSEVGHPILTAETKWKYLDKNTTLTGKVSVSKAKTYSFQHDFELEDASLFSTAYYRIGYNNAVTIYINGHRIGRHNTTDDYAENVKFVDIENLLKKGTNTITVELLKNAKSSTDIYLNFTTFILLEGGYEVPPIEITNINIAPGSNESERNFTWLSNADEGGVLTLWEKGAESKAVTYVAKSEKLSVREGYLTSKVTVTGLKPGKTYLYSLTNGDPSDDGVDAGPYTFTTDLSTDSFTFLMVNDSQIGKNGEVEPVAIAWRNTWEKVTKAWSNISFVVSTGDQVESPSNEDEYDCYFSPEKMTSIPVATTVGSHDNSSNYTGHFNPPNLSKYGATKTSSDYWFTYGNVLFMSLNTNERSETDIAEHVQFMKETIKTYKEANGSAPDWIVLFFHYGPYGTGEHTNDDDIRLVREKLTPVIAELNIDVVLNGHDHTYARSLMMGGTGNANGGTVEAGTAGSKPITKGYTSDGDNLYAAYTKNYGETVYITGNTSSKGFNPIKTTDFDFVAKADQQNRPSITLIEVTADSLILKSYYSDTDINEANLFDTFTLTANRSSYSGNTDNILVDKNQPMIKKGSQGISVSALQNLLNAALTQTLKVDGIFGNKTNAAVREFQKLNGLKVDGIVGQKTWAVLLKLKSSPFG